MAAGAAVAQKPQFAGANQAKSVLNEWFATRGPYRDAFLKQCGWQGAVITPLREDMAARRYYRLSKGDQTSVLMESVPDDHEYATPGHLVADYVAIAELMRAGGLATPKIYATDIPNGYVLLEDFGDVSFRAALMSGAVSRDEIYNTAAAVVQKIYQVKWPQAQKRDDYYEGTMYKGLRRMIDWYVPVKRGIANAPDMVNEFLNRWQQVEDAARAQVGAPIQGFVHCDFHLENLQWRADQAGMARAGLLDFQDARMGPAVYDLTNLLNDARVSLPPDVKRAYLNQFLAGIPEGDRANFERWFWIYSAQFLHRVAGQFIKHAIIGNTRYLQFMPFIQTNLKDIYDHDFLAPVTDYFDQLKVDLEPFPDGFDFAAHAEIIAKDAY